MGTHGWHPHIFSDRDAFISFLDIKKTTIFKHLNRITNAFCQLGIIEIFPLHRKFAIFVQKGHEAWRKRGYTTPCFRTDDSIGWNIDTTQIGPIQSIDTIYRFIQNRQLPLFPIFFTHFFGFTVFFHTFPFQNERN